MLIEILIGGYFIIGFAAALIFRLMFGKLPIWIWLGIILFWPVVFISRIIIISEI